MTTVLSETCPMFRRSVTVTLIESVPVRVTADLFTDRKSASGSARVNWIVVRAVVSEPTDADRLTVLAVVGLTNSTSAWLLESAATTATLGLPGCVLDANVPSDTVNVTCRLLDGSDGETVATIRVRVAPSAGTTVESARTVMIAFGSI